MRKNLNTPALPNKGFRAKRKTDCTTHHFKTVPNEKKHGKTGQANSIRFVSE
jgi:hypothetical protein